VSFNRIRLEDRDFQNRRNPNWNHYADVAGVAAVPEPSTTAIAIAAACAGIALIRRRRTSTEKNFDKQSPREDEATSFSNRS